MSSGVRDVAAGSSHSMAIKQDGSVWGTGENLYGQLGDGSMVSKEIYVRVLRSHDGAWFAAVAYLEFEAIHFPNLTMGKKFL